MTRFQSTLQDILLGCKSNHNFKHQLQELFLLFLLLAFALSFWIYFWLADIGFKAVLFCLLFPLAYSFKRLHFLSASLLVETFLSLGKSDSSSIFRTYSCPYYYRRTETYYLPSILWTIVYAADLFIYFSIMTKSWSPFFISGSLSATKV